MNPCWLPSHKACRSGKTAEKGCRVGSESRANGLRVLNGRGDGNYCCADPFSIPLYLALGWDEVACRTAYRALFRANLEEMALDDIRKAVQQGLPLGNDRFREQVEAVLGRRMTLGRRG